ncbi:MAG: transcriptional repressor [Treponema sp.]|nr:transcriptional repressor [Treponema sp.]
MVKHGQKHSKKRDAILRLLQSTKTHPGARWVHEQLKPLIPDLSLGTVYRNLNLFHEEGKALSLGVVNGEERFDGMIEPHPHFVCSACGTVIDIPAELPSRIPEGELPFTIDFRRTVFYGLCDACKNAKR